MPETKTLEDLLESQTREGECYEKLPDNKVRCYACGHECLILEGRPGVCRVRFNQGGTLKAPFGYVAALQCDPVEKKPFFHAYPGSLAMSFGMLGCDLHCSYCQNWVTSQALRDPRAGSETMAVTPGQFVDIALRYRARIVTSTYNEPLITAEWAVAIFKKARQHGLVTSFVSNGNATRGVLEYLKPWVDLYKVDLKSFQDKNYRQLGGRLEPILNTIRMLREMGFWVEIVTLVVPGLNDSEEELRDMARFLVSVSPDIPWHVTAFHQDYKMQDRDNTSARALIQTAEMGYSEGLRYVYAGNLPGRMARFENTYCPACKELLIERTGFRVLGYRLKPGGFCPKCETTIPGRWD
ncbi:MAG: AmmeMemoRadiSam system radical SAM enzyme [Armatimonadetes bacterium]|nr:AmmeMemoRadiSam system radical SAM enzyme [Armatimonadota bacterium]